MDPERVPHLDWPSDLFRSAVDTNVIDDPDNPFLEESDFVTEAWPLESGDHIPSRACALAE